MTTFVVSILTTNKDLSSTRITNLKRLFPESRYVVRVDQCIPPSSLVSTTAYTAQQQAETICINKILSESRTQYPSAYVLIIKDTSITVSTSEQIYQLLNQATEQAGWELFYLTKWLDRCDLYGIPQNVKNKTYTFINTFSPNGFQAIMFSPRGRDVILGEIPMKNGKLFPPVTQPIEIQLNSNIANGNIIAISTVPNAFEYDISLATNTADFEKANLCSDVSLTGGINQNGGSGTEQTGMSFIWYVIIIIMVILIVVALWYLFGGNHPKEKKKEEFNL